MELVLFDIHAKQRFIFSSTRLKENVGASFQITLLDSWVGESVAKLNLSAQWVSRSSGRLLLMLDCDSSARKLIGEVTRRAHAEAPEMDVSGVFVHMVGSYLSGDDLRAVDHVAYQYALNRSPALSRFAQMPFLLRANDSSLPAAPSYADSGEVAAPSSALEGRALSLPAQVKVRQANIARDHFLNLARVQRLLYDEDEKLARDPTKLEELLQTASEGGVGVPSKVAVIHIDGNGVGGVMRRLDEVLSEKSGALKGELEVPEGDSDALRVFVLKISERLDVAVKVAFRSAWERVAKLARKDAEDSNRRYTAIPVVPVILGGDDVTVITSGDYALPFAAGYLRYYEEATGNDPILRYLTPPEGQDTGPMTAAAGVAIVKRNFPFHIAYELAEKLVDRAKKVGKTAQPPCSTLDYHVLFDTTVLDPDEAIRGYERFTTRPFRLLNDETSSVASTCNVGSRTSGSGDDEDSTSADSSTNGLRHEPWEATCRRVARFKGVSLGSTDERRNETDLVEPFPRTRAARIRGLLSAAVRERAAHRDDDVTDAPAAEAADRETPGSEASDNKEAWVPPSLGRAGDEWKAARKEVGTWIDTELGGLGAMFDLLELSDLLPPSFFPSLGEAPNTASEATE